MHNPHQWYQIEPMRTAVSSMHPTHLLFVVALIPARITWLLRSYSGFDQQQQHHHRGVRSDAVREMWWQMDPGVSLGFDCLRA